MDSADDFIAELTAPEDVDDSKPSAGGGATATERGNFLSNCCKIGAASSGVSNTEGKTCCDSSGKSDCQTDKAEYVHVDSEAKLALCCNSAAKLLSGCACSRRQKSCCKPAALIVEGKKNSCMKSSARLESYCQSGLHKGITCCTGCSRKDPLGQKLCCMTATGTTCCVTAAKCSSIERFPMCNCCKTPPIKDGKPERSICVTSGCCNTGCCIDQLKKDGTYQRDNSNKEACANSRRSCKGEKEHCDDCACPKKEAREYFGAKRCADCTCCSKEDDGCCKNGCADCTCCMKEDRECCKIRYTDRTCCRREDSESCKNRCADCSCCTKEAKEFCTEGSICCKIKEKDCC